MYSYRVYKKLVRKLIHYGNKKIFFYRVCFSKRTKNSRGEIQIEIFVRTFYTPCITIKIFLITVMYQFSYELFIHPVLQYTTVVERNSEQIFERETCCGYVHFRIA